MSDHIQSLKTKKRRLEAIERRRSETDLAADTYSLRSGRSARSGASNNSQSTMRRIGAVVGQYVASPVVESMDVNAIVNEIDWNEVLEKVDINEVIFDRIDVNRLLDRVDVNRHLDRVDVNQHLEKVDWDALVERSNLEEIIARSTSGVLSGFASLLRTRLAWIDQWGQRVGRCYCCGKNRECVDFLPPRPGRPEDSRAVWKTPETLDKLEFERAIQFRTCGATSHLLFLSLDWMFLWTVFAAVAAIVNELTIVFAGDPDYWDKYPSVQNFWFDVFLYAVAAALYWVFMVGCVGRTFGMWILGLVMVTTEGKRVSLVQVCKQVLLIPPNMLLFGWVLGYTRRDGAFASDILGDVSVVYAWGARLLPKNKHPEMAMSLGDFVESIPEHERENLLKVPENLNVRLGGDDYNGDDDACLDNDSVKGNSGSVEITNLEDAASRWSKENI